MTCEHRFTYVGVRYAHGEHNRPGSGAKQRYYAHVYLCERCTEKRYEAIADVDDCSYFNVRFGATPGDRVAIVPEHDR